MYSRKSNRSPIPPHLPEHYSGWAFRPQPPPGDRPPEPPKVPQDRPPHRPPEPPRPLPFLPPPVSSEKPLKKDPPRCDVPASGEPLPPPLLPPAIGHLFGKGDLLRSMGLDFEELLIIGLILLLGGNDEDNELPLLLALLLFCG